jgi:hypothetical protein
MIKPQDTLASDEKSSPTPTRKAYEKPQLQVYGDLAEITRSIAGTMMSDGAGHPNMHFTS